MSKGNSIEKNINNMKYLYDLIVNHGRTEYKDEYICSFQIVNNHSVRVMPKKYRNLYNQLCK